VSADSSDSTRRGARLRTALRPAPLLATLLVVASVLGISIVAGYPDLCFRSIHERGDDDLEFTVPFALALKASVASGHWPLWNAATDAGIDWYARFPYLDPFYPSVALFAALPPPAALNSSWILHLALAGLGAAFLARTLGGGRIAAAFAAVAYVESSAFRANVGEGYLMAIVAFAWFPWLLACIERGCLRRGARAEARWLGAGAAVAGLMLLGGQPTDLVACALVGGVYLVVVLASERERPPLAAVAKRLAAMALLGVGIGALFWAPALHAVAASGGVPELAMKSTRGGSLADLLRFLTPHDAWGTSQDRHLPFIAWGLALGAPFVARGRRTAALAIAAFTSLVLSLGRATPLWWALREAIPIFRAVDTSVAYVSALALFVALLAARCIDSALDRAAARGWSSARVMTLALFAALAADVALYQSPACSRHGERFALRTSVGSDPILTRIAAAADGRLLDHETHVTKQRLTLRRNESMALGLEDARISSHFPSSRMAKLAARVPEVLLDWRDFSHDLARLVGHEDQLADPRAARALDLLGVRWLITDVDVSTAGELVIEDAGRRLYERKTAWPRAFLVARTERTSEARCLDRLFDPSFDPTRVALVESDDRASPAPDSPSDRSGEVTILSRVSGSMRLKIESTAPSLLVIDDIYDAGWRARVDGASATVVPAQCALMGVAIGPGEHQVEMSYLPLGFAAGLITGTLSIAAVVALVLFGRRLHARA